MNESHRQEELLEIYKLHAEFADRVSGRREGANRLFVSLLVGLLVFLGLFIRFGVNGIAMPVVFLVTGATGAILSCSWYIIIRSYRQLNTGKFHILLELEKQLAFPFYQKEWDYLQRGENISRYWKLSVVETSLPIIFCSLSVLVFAIGLFQLL